MNPRLGNAINRNGYFKRQRPEIAAANESYKNIGKGELEKIINKLDVKKASQEDKTTNQIIKLTYNRTKSLLLKLFSSSLYHRYYPKAQIRMLYKLGKPFEGLKESLKFCRIVHSA